MCFCRQLCSSITVDLICISSRDYWNIKLHMPAQRLTRLQQMTDFSQCLAMYANTINSSTYNGKFKAIQLGISSYMPKYVKVSGIKDCPKLGTLTLSWMLSWSTMMKLLQRTWNLFFSISKIKGLFVNNKTSPLWVGSVQDFITVNLLRNWIRWKDLLVQGAILSKIQVESVRIGSMLILILRFWRLFL